MPRGITQPEVFAAAEAVLARGLRPTIERVRAELGRGSPNTVNRLLDAWWTQLASRMLAVEGKALPARLLAAVDEVYSLAIDAAKTEAVAILSTRAQELAVRESALTAGEAELISRTAGFQASADTLRLEITRMTELAASTAAERAALSSDLASERQRSQAFEAQLVTSTRRAETQARKDEAELLRVREKAALAEDRLLRQIDALRGDVKTLKADKLEQSKKRDREVSTLLEKLTASQRQQTTLQQAADYMKSKLHAQELRLAKAPKRGKSATDRPAPKKAKPVV